VSKKFVFFDVDETLVYQKGSVRAAMALALQEVYGQTGPIEDYVMDGKTDPQIFRELLSLAGFSEEAVERKLDHACDAYCRTYPKVAKQIGIEACPGAAELLQTLSKEAQAGEVTLGLLTGNLECVAFFKLETVGIDVTIFKLGAFGSDASDRNTLAKIAKQRASKMLGKKISDQNVIIIGDTPHDIKCAQAINAGVVSVSTGRYSSQELEFYQPTFSFPNLTDKEAILRAIRTQTS
jgi:phosphoglycolate phosphatase-like HAD superfamily hydrolase